MRLVIAAALALTAAPSAFAQQVPVAPLAADEILLEIDALGTSTVRAEITTLSVPLVSTASTAAAARAANATLIERATAAARRAGVPADSIRLEAPSPSFGFVGNEAPDEVLAAIQAAQPQPPPIFTERSTLEIRLRDARQFESVRSALETAGVQRVPDPVYSVRDEAPARRAAKADALRKAREEAEAYAQSIGMRVVRIVRVSERAPGDLAKMGTMYNSFRSMFGKSGSATPDYETKAIVAVDFALRPK